MNILRIFCDEPNGCSAIDWSQIFGLIKSHGFKNLEQLGIQYPPVSMAIPGSDWLEVPIPLI